MNARSTTQHARRAPRAVRSTTGVPCNRFLRPLSAMACVGFPVAIIAALIAKCGLHLTLSAPLAMLLCGLGSATSTLAARISVGEARRFGG